MQEETALTNEVKAPEAPSDKVAGQHYYFISKSMDLDDVLQEVKDKGLKLLGYKRLGSVAEPVKNKHGIMSQPSWQANWLVKCMNKV